MYSKEVVDHFTHPRNSGKIKDADGIGKVGNFNCGDIMYIYLKIAKNKKGEEYIKDIKFETLGCAAAIATSSKTTEIAKGKTLTEALKIGKEEIAKGFDLPPIKLHCSVLADDALKEAIYDYYKKQGKKMPAELEKAHIRIIKELDAAEHKH